MDNSVKKIFMPDVACVKFSIWRIFFGNARFARISHFFKSATNRYIFPEENSKFEAPLETLRSWVELWIYFLVKLIGSKCVIVKTVTAILEWPCSSITLPIIRSWYWNLNSRAEYLLWFLIGFIYIFIYLASDKLWMNCFYN